MFKFSVNFYMENGKATAVYRRGTHFHVQSYINVTWSVRPLKLVLGSQDQVVALSRLSMT